MSRTKIDVTGQVNNKLTVLGFAYRKGNRSHWKIKCTCGSNSVMTVAQFRKNVGCKTCYRDNTPDNGPMDRRPFGMGKFKPTRLCNKCNKLLPFNRYFNHVECVADLSDMIYLTERYQIHV